MTTISKVAEKAGVSRTTVSHVLNHADRVSGHLRERVQQAIAELGYVPNPQAKSLRTGRTNVVAMLIPDIRNPYYPELVGVVQNELDAVGRDTMVFNADVPGGHSQEHTRHYLREIQAKRVDGLIVSDFALHGMQEAIADVQIPTALIGYLPSRVVDTVEADVAEGCREMAHYLVSRGHRRIGHVTGPSYFGEARMRSAGFTRGLEEAGVGDELRFEGGYLPPGGAAAARAFMERPRRERPTAIFFANYLMAVGGLAVLYDLGLKVPDDVAVAIYGDQPQMEYVRPRLTHVGRPPSDLAREASRMLIDRLEGSYSGAPRHLVLPSKLVALESA